MNKPKCRGWLKISDLDEKDKICLENGVKAIPAGYGGDTLNARYNRARKEFLLNICRASLMNSLKNAMSSAYKKNLDGYTKAMKVVRATLKEQDRGNQ